MTRMTAPDCVVMCNLINTHTYTHTHTHRTGTGTKIGLGRAEGRRRNARNHTRVVDALWEKEETWAERGKNVDKEGLVQ